MKVKIETERVDLFDVSIVITMCVNLEKEVLFSELKTAFDKACKLHGVLKSKVIIEPDGEAYYVDNDVISSSFSMTGLSLYELIYENERNRFRIEEGEFIRAFLSPDGLVFMMHHLGGDGKSLLYFIETFMNCLAGNECNELLFRNLGLSDLPGDVRIPFFYKLLTKSWNHRWSSQKKVFDYSDMDEAYTKFWKEHRSVTEIKRYEKDELEALMKRVKDSGVTLTSYLITDMIKDSDKKNDIGLAVDGRTDKNRSMGNQATGISVEYRYDKSRSFEENAKAVHTLMQKKLSDDIYRYFVLGFMGLLDPTLKDALNLEHAGCFSSKVSKQVADLLGYGEKVKDISITNLTRADISLEYGDHRIKDIAFIPPVVSYAKNVIGIVTAGDVMTVSRHIIEKADS